MNFNEFAPQISTRPPIQGRRQENPLGLDRLQFVHRPPPSAHASEITDKDGNSLIGSDPVHDLYAQELDGNLARSVYDKFNLSENEIANLHFNKQGESVYAFDLVNFVNNKVDVNGTVNAIRDGAVDGNLYFLSPEGIAVGASGVINAGAFNAYSVDSSDYKSMRDGTMANLRQEIATNITGGYTTASDKAVEINGVINARNLISLHGKEVNINSGATLNAKTDIDFTTLVNAGDTVNTIENLNMTADPAGTGDIVITVSAVHNADDSIFGTMGGNALTVWPGNKTTTLKPAITINGDLEAAGGVTLVANSTTAFNEGSLLNLIGSVKGSILNQVGLDIDADWIDKTNNATITVGGNINSGGDVTFNAGANTQAVIMSTTPENRQSTALTNLIPTIAFVYSKIDNNAVVDVKGNVNAAGSVKADATAGSDLYALATAATLVDKTVTNSVVYTGISVANVNNKAEISFNNVNAGGDFTAKAEGSYRVDNNAISVIPDASFLSTAIAINQGDSKALVNLNGDVTAGGSIDVDANNKDVYARATATNELGDRNIIINGQNIRDLNKIENGLSDSIFSVITEWIGAKKFIGDHSFNIMPGDSVASKFFTGGYFKTGMSVDVITNNHDAKINVADGAKLNATGDIALDALLTTKDLHAAATNVLNNKTEGSSTNVGVGGAVNVVDVNNDSNVVVGKNVDLTGANVSISTITKADYNQFTAEMNQIKEAWKNLAEIAKKFGANFSNGDADIDKAINELGTITDKTKYAMKLGEIQGKIEEHYNHYNFKSFTDTISDGANVYNLLKGALATTFGVLDPANYVNFYARSTIQDGQAGSSASKADISGSVQVLGVKDNALTLLGEGVKVNGGNVANITSSASTDLVELTGQGGKYLAANDMGAGAGVGASVVITGIDTYATTAIGKNNTLNANTLNVHAHNTVDQKGIIYGSGAAGKVGVSGMMNMMYGDSFAIASIDDQTNITAKDVSVMGKNETDITAVTGGVTVGDTSTAAAVGAGFNLNNFDVHSFATIADNSSDQAVDDTTLTASEIAAIEAAVDQDINDGKIDAADRTIAISEAITVIKKAKLSNDHAKDVENKRIDAVKALRKSLSDDQINLLGTKDTAQGSISANNLTVDANTDGTINSVAVEGSWIGDKNNVFNSVNKILNSADDFSNVGVILLEYPSKKLSSTLGGKFSDYLKYKIEENTPDPDDALITENGGQKQIARDDGLIHNDDNDIVGGKENLINNNPSENGNGLNRELQDADNAGTGNETDDDEEPNDEADLFGEHSGLSAVKFHLAGAGSVAVNASEGDTVALVDNNIINVNNLTVKSNDDLYNGAYAGGAAINWAKSNVADKTGTVGGAASVNKGDRKVDALVANSSIERNNGDINLNASKNGVDVAASLGLALAVSSGSDDTNVSAGVGVNLADNDVRALLVNSNTAANALNLNSKSNDILVAGGADVALALGTGGASNAVTASVMIANLDNDLQAGIFGGNHSVGNLDISTVKSDVIVDAALSFSLASSNDPGFNAGLKAVDPYSFGGTFTYGQINSTSDAFIDKTTINANSINLLNDQKANDNSKRQALIDNKLDIDGDSYMGAQAKDNIDPVNADGAVIVGAAVGVNVSYTQDPSSSARGIDAAVAVNKLNIVDNVSINNSTINAPTVIASSNDKLRIVNVSAGATGSEGAFTNKMREDLLNNNNNEIELIQIDPNNVKNYRGGLNIVGSVGWNVGSVNNAVNVDGSNINSDNIIIKSNNDSQAVNVAGEIAVGDAATLGLALASNSLDNTVQASVNNSAFNGIDGANNSILIDSQNRSKVVEVAASVNVSTSAKDLNGNVAINSGSNNTRSFANNLTANNVDALNITSSDNATKTTVAGSVNVSSGAQLGAAVAFSRIGSSDKHEILQSTIANSTINAHDNADISLKTCDDSAITTTAAGIGISFGATDKFRFAAQGAGAASYITKDVDAGLLNSRITGKPNLYVDAQSASDSKSVAAIIAGSWKANITSSIGVAVNDINQNTNSFFNNDQLNSDPSELANVVIRSQSLQNLTGGVGSGGVSILDTSVLTGAGSGSHNHIGSNTSANVKNLNASATKNFGVVAQSDDILANYAGTVDVTGGTVGLGVSASNNKITGDTIAKVTGSTLSVAGSDQADDLIKVNHNINDGVLITKAVNDSTWKARGLADNRSSDNLSGIVIDASATHGLSSDLASASVQFGESGANVAGSLNFVNISGNTNASFDNSSNSALDGNKGSVNVGAFDYTNKGGFIGGAVGSGSGETANIAAGVSVAVSNVERNVLASVNNQHSDPLNIDAHDFNVHAVNKQGISDFMLNASVAVAERFALQTADNAASNNNSSSTKTTVNNVTVNFDGNSDISALHELNANSLNVAAGLSLAFNFNPKTGGSAGGALNTGIAVTKDTATVNNLIRNSKLIGSDSSNADISTFNTSRINNDLYSIGGAIALLSAGVAGDIAVNHMNTTTNANIDNSTVKAANINVTTSDNVKLEVEGGAGSFGTLAGVGAAVNVNRINNNTNSNITGSTLDASGSLTVDTKELRNFDSTLVAAGLAGIGAGVNVMTTTVNSNIADIDSPVTRNLIDGHIDKVNEDRFNPDDVHGMSTSDKASYRNTNAALKISTDPVHNEGVITNVAGSTLNAGATLKINSTEQNDGKIVNGTGALGLAGVAVGDSILNFNHKSKTLLTTSDITGGTVSIGATQSQSDKGIKSNVYEVGVGALGVGVGYNSLTLKGDTAVNVKGSNIKSTNGDINITALDNAKTDVYNLGVEVALLSVPTTIGKSINDSATTVLIEKSEGGSTINSDLSATDALNIKARSANEAYVEVQSGSAGAGVIANTWSTARDSNKASVLVTDASNRFEGKSINLTAESDPSIYAYAPNISPLKGAGFNYVDTTAEIKGGSLVAVAAGNTFDGRSVNYKATTGSSNTNRKSARAEMFSINGGGLSVETAPSIADIITDTWTDVKVGNQTYKNSPDITVESTSQLNKDAYANGFTIGLAISSGRDKARVNSTDKVVAEIGTDNSIENNAGSLTVNAANKNLTDLKATGGSGGLLDIASQSTTDNTGKIDVAAKVGGTWNVNGAVSINATSDDTVRGYARQGHGGVAGGAGVYADSNIKGTTQATVDDNAKITASSLEMNALNTFKTDGYKGEESYLLADYYGGALTGDRLTTDVVIEKNAYANINSNASITTTGKQSYIAKSDGNVMNKINAAGGGLINGVGAYADTTVTTRNKVNFGKGTKATATDESDFIIKATDLLNVDSLSAGTNGGVMAVLINETTNNINRTNTIDVKGDLTTAGAIDVEAGGSKDAFFDNARQIYVKTVTESNNYTLLQISTPTAEYKLDEQNSIDVSGSINSGHDVNMRADGGKFEVIYSSRTGKYSNLEKFNGKGIPDLSNADGTAEKGTYATNLTSSDTVKRNNYINVDGSITAGNDTKDVEINITGKVIPDNYYIAGTSDSGTLKVTSNTDKAVDYTEGTLDYANELASRRATLIDLVNQYTTGSDGSAETTAAVAGFLAEIERVEEKMRDLGLVVSEGDAENNSVLTGGVDVRYVELGNIALSGGNVNLNSENVKGTGSLTAKGAPNLTINNTSNAYLRVNDVKLGGASGNVNLMGHPVLAGDAGIASTLNLSTAYLSGAGNITIYNNPDIARINLVSKDDTSLTGTYDPRPDLRLKGTIDNTNGDVRITNTRGDIDISSEYERDSDGNITSSANRANINGKNIYIEANGTINQGFVEGLVNVGGTPEYILRADAIPAQNAARNSLDKTAAKSTYSKTVKENAVDGGDVGNGRIAGNNIYLAAMDININGVLQAGYETYRTTVTDADVEGLKAELASDDTAALDQRMKDASGRYAVNKAGAKYDAAKGYYDYELPVYYDTASDKLILEDLETGGGKIYISGRVASTGSGKIYAANGYATINIANNTDLPLEVGKVINNERQAKITIVDTALDTWTEYTPGQTRVIRNYGQMLKEHFADGMLYDTVETTENNLNELNPDTGAYYTAVYQPATGLRYNWTAGESTKTEQIYHHEEDGWGILFTDFLFGAIIHGAERDKVESWEKDTTPRSTSGTSELDTGGYLTENGSTDDNMNLSAESVRTDRTGPILIAKDTKVKSYIIVNKYTFTMDWKYITGSTQSYNFDINASKPITIGFLGRRQGPTSVTSNGSIRLTGDMEMSDALTTLTMYSNRGGISQLDGTALRLGGAFLRARDNISGLNIETMGRKLDSGEYVDEIPLDVQSTGGGDIDINVLGGTTDGHAMPGDIFLDGEGVKSAASDGKRGDVTIKATGHIRGINGATGKTVVVTSENKGVGTDRKTPMRLDATNAVEVNAKGDIYAASPYNGTLNVGRMKSDEGEVYLTKTGINGNIAQVSTYQTGAKVADTSELIHQWVDAGVIAPTEDYEGTYVKGLSEKVTEYETQIKTEYDQYESGKEEYAKLKETTESEYAEYESIKGGYNDYRNATDEAFTEYLDDTEQIRNRLATEYSTMENYRAKTNAFRADPKNNKPLTSSQTKKLAAYEAKYVGCTSADDYYIINARTLLTNPDHQKFVGYKELDEYMLSTRQGQLMSKYGAYASAEAYLATTEGYAKEQKYGSYADVAAYLASDAQYKELVDARDNPKFQSTLEEMLAQAEVERAAAEYNVSAKHFYLDNKRIK